MKRFITGICACVCVAAGSLVPAACAVDTPTHQANKGSLQLALTGVSNSGAVYRLRNGDFTITGPTNTTLSTEADPNAASLVLDLPAGSYQIELAPGWSLEREQSPGLFQPVEATLDSANPSAFDIVDQGHTGVAFQFRAGTDVIELGSGQLEVTIDVDDVNCAAGQTQCGTSCVDTQTDSNNCGACGNVCAASGGTASCVGGVCSVSSCDPGLASCDGLADNGCETDLGADVNHCGACGNVCATVPSATSVCEAGACEFVCLPGFEDCDTLATNGCEADLMTSLNNCGACGLACVAPNAAPLCSAGACTLGPCNPGFANCDGNPANGCELLLDSNPICGAAINGPVISGDGASGSTFSTNGTGEQRFRFQIAETDTSTTTARPLSVMFTLSGPAGASYRLEAGCDGCTPMVQSPGQVTLRWNEETTNLLGIEIPTGTDSGRPVYVSVVYMGGSVCGNWNLQVQGNVPTGALTCSTK